MVVFSAVKLTCKCFGRLLNVLRFQEKGEGIVAGLDESRHGFETGDYVRFDEVKVRIFLMSLQA